MKTVKKRPLFRSEENFADYLIRQGVLSVAQVEVVYEEQALHEFKQLNLQEEKAMYAGANERPFLGPLSFERIVLSLGFLQEDQLLQYLSTYSRYDCVDLKEYPYDADLLENSFLPLLKKYRVFPLKKSVQSSLNGLISIVELAIVDPYDVKALDHIRLLYQVDQLTIYLCTEQNLIEIFDRVLLEKNIFLELLKKIPIDTVRLRNMAENPVEDLIYFILTQALHQQATDVHFQPHRQWVQLSYRIKGLLQSITVFHKKYWPFISTRLKIMAYLDIANQRLPQSGQFIFWKGYQEIACRLSTHPLMTSNGTQEEGTVLRFLNPDHGFFSIEKLGFNQENQKKLKKIGQESQGLTIIAGPTGSGKTTTAYAVLKTLNHQWRKIMTLEEPIEFFFSFLHQTEIRQQDDLHFEEALRSILRQDPDLLFIGEIRDRKAAQLAIQTAMIGHPVFTTLHASDALSVVPRLVNLGVDPKILTNRIHTIVSQRLVGHLCPLCKRAALKQEVESFYHVLLPFLYVPQGCEQCCFSGYQSRIPLIEILEINDAFHQLISSNDYDRHCKQWAESVGFIPLAQVAFESLLKGDICLKDAVSETSLKQWMRTYPTLVTTLLQKH